MPEIAREPQKIDSMEELLSVAGAMEREAIEGYRLLSVRMAEEGRPDLKQVFDQLIAEEEEHLFNVAKWQRNLGLSERLPEIFAHEPLFDDEDIAIVAADLLSAYRAFSVAVRNEERAFVFWSYVASHAPNGEIRQAAERMAAEELGHVATLRKERRHAFHIERRSPDFGIEAEIVDLERQAAELAQTGAQGPAGSGTATELAARRVIALQETPLKRPALLDRMPKRALTKQLSIHELLLDCYLDAAEKEDDIASRQQAQRFAAEILQILTSLRATSAKTSFDQELPTYRFNSLF